ncbi:Bidirectional sugar transporter SWEET10 [Forsythia ovata]|uniref:Bidirectional sugar transporter SWEET n=1 Tax=Forsythia ovata TaxID=205694 RepID=A0ABD1X409_9LAMI
MALLTAAHMACTFGILGNIVSFLVYMAPVPTFYRICKRKSTEGFQSIPYSVALFSAMLYLYYAFLKKNVIMLITINSVGCVFEVVFLSIFMVYATNQSKIFTTKLIILFNIGTLGLIIGSTYFLSEGHKRVTIVGWICSAFSISVFAAPLSIMRQVIRTKSVEYMPLPLSFFLTICAIVWFFYGLLINDFYIAAPNVVGFFLGIAQMVLYGIYKNKRQKIILPEIKLHDTSTIIDLKAQVQMQNSSTVDIAAVIDHNHKGTDLDPNEDSLAEYAAAATDSIV